MSQRIFPDWLTAYQQYSDDGFTPRPFNEWVGLSVVAGVLERKCWLPWSDTFSYYPNIFVLLVSLPGAGKSTALNKGMGLLHEMNTKLQTMSIIPSKVTEAKFIELMGTGTQFEHGSKLMLQNAGFYWSSEASNTLRKGGFYDLTSCLTDFYDCPPFWENATKKEGRSTLRNICINVLAGSTFDYLSKLVTDDDIMGGFASRLIFVVHREALVRNQAFQLGGGGSIDPGRAEYRSALVQDLEQMHKMVGPFKASAEFGKAWEEWYPAFEKMRQAHPSEKMQSLLVRTNTNVIKVAMLMSASESNNRLLTLEHWNKALQIVEPIGKDIPNIFRAAKAMDTTSQEGLNNAIARAFEHSVEMNVAELKRKLIVTGFSPRDVNQTVDSLLNVGHFTQLSNGRIKLLGDAQNYF